MAQTLCVRDGRAIDVASVLASATTREIVGRN